MQIPYHRRSDGRIATMLQRYDFRGKHVLDIGCNTGYITSALSHAGAGIIGMDSDPKVIAIARKRYSYIQFCMPSDIGNDHFDCVILLSVLQHILRDMNCYRQSDHGMQPALDFMKIIRSKTNSLWFEMALPNEVHRSRSAYLPDMGPSPPRWIIDNILNPAGFCEVHIFPAPELKNNKWQSYLHNSWYTPLVKAPQFVRNVLQFDDRDARPLFFAR